MLLLGHRRDSGPFGQQQFFGIQRVHGQRQLRGDFSFTAPRPACGDTDVHTMSKQMKNRAAMIELLNYKLTAAAAKDVGTLLINTNSCTSQECDSKSLFSRCRNRCLPRTPAP